MDLNVPVIPNLQWQKKSIKINLKQTHAYTQAALMTMDTDVSRGKLNQLK